MDKIKEMGEGIDVKDAPVHKTTAGGVLARGKRSAADGNTEHFLIKLTHLFAFELSVCFHVAEIFLINQYQL